jgi:hypothetical protein
MSAENPPAGTWERDEAAVAWSYGSILAAAAVVGAGKVAHTAGRAGLYVSVTAGVIWLAHSYAAFVGHGGRIDLPGRAKRLRHALVTETAILGAFLPAVIAFVACSLLDTSLSAAGYLALGATILTMAVAAGTAARRTGAGAAGAALAALGALLIGGALIAAKVALK